MNKSEKHHVKISSTAKVRGIPCSNGAFNELNSDSTHLLHSEISNPVGVNQRVSSRPLVFFIKIASGSQNAVSQECSPTVGATSQSRGSIECAFFCLKPVPLGGVEQAFRLVTLILSLASPLACCFAAL